MSVVGPVHDPAEYARAAAVVVPARLFDRPLARRLREAAWNGASVLIELGLAFVDEPHVRAQRRLISEEFDLTLGDVVRLWDGGRQPRAVRAVSLADRRVGPRFQLRGGREWGRVAGDCAGRDIAGRGAPAVGARVAHDPRVTVGSGVASRGRGGGGVVSPLPAW